jgi:alanine dehydrogenase
MAMEFQGTLLLTGSEVRSLLTIEACIAAVEHAFNLHGENKTRSPGILGIHVENGGFHIKAGLLELSRSYFAAKVNANFPRNPQVNSLPTIQGAVVLCDGENGYPLAVLDSIEITTLRTGAATAVAAKHLARPDSKVVTVCGCGNQGRISLKALTTVLPIEAAWVFDNDRTRAEILSKDLREELGIDIDVATDLQAAARQSDICVTCTPAKKPFFEEHFISPGTFVAAVGADNPEKQELQSTILSTNKVVVDVLEQSATIGEFHHALAAGLMTKNDIHAELGEITSGTKAGRISSDEIIIFDSTGMALQDVVAAATVYEEAAEQGMGSLINFSQ